MSKKDIDELLDLLEANFKDELGDENIVELDEGSKALVRGDFEEAWENFYAISNSKDPALHSYKGEAMYGLFRVMQEIPLEHEFLQHLINIDTGLIKKSKTKQITKEYGRAFIARKYLRLSADDYNYYPAVVEYALNCVGSGGKNSFVFKYNDQDALVGLAWADILIRSNVDEIKGKGHIVHAKYHFARCLETKSPEEVRLFCENVIAAKDLLPDDDEYILYFYGMMCAQPMFKSFEQGTYYNPKKGYELFCKVIPIAQDPDIVESASKIKAMFETKYSSMIEK